MSTNTYTLHRNVAGAPDDVRIVPDGFRLSVFLLPPAALLARGLWGATLVWLAFVAACGAAAYADLVAPIACFAALIVLHGALALDAADLERRRLARRGWTLSAIVGPLGEHTAATTQATRTSPSGVTAPASSGADVIGFFPS